MKTNIFADFQICIKFTIKKIDLVGRCILKAFCFKKATLYDV